jgi:N-acetylmuramoyl-L-alanine amidase
MSRERLVQQGDHLSKIAAEEGFADFHTILDHPDNADTSAKRDPHVLFPGDLLAIPDREDGEETGGTENVHTFQTDLQPLYLRCELLDIDGKPITAAPCDLKIEGDEIPAVTTDGKGILIQAIARTDKTAAITVHLPAAKKPAPKAGGEEAAAPPEPAIPFEVKIGNLNPEKKMSGQQARLNNMGYFAGFTLKDLDQLLWAAEEFACDHVSKPVKKRPDIEPAPETGEEDPDNADPDSKTGIQDAALTSKLKTVHGI